MLTLEVLMPVSKCWAWSLDDLDDLFWSPENLMMPRYAKITRNLTSLLGCDDVVNHWNSKKTTTRIELRLSLHLVTACWAMSMSKVETHKSNDLIDHDSIDQFMLTSRKSQNVLRLTFRWTPRLTQRLNASEDDNKFATNLKKSFRWPGEDLVKICEDLNWRITFFIFYYSTCVA